QRFRLLRAVAGSTHREGDGGIASTSRSRAGDPHFRQGHVPHPVIVQKYGGTSVGSAARIRRVSSRIAETVASGEQVVTVVSAMGHPTDRLSALPESIKPEPPARDLGLLGANWEAITAPPVAHRPQGRGGA